MFCLTLSVSLLRFYFVIYISVFVGKWGGGDHYVLKIRKGEVASSLFHLQLLLSRAIKGKKVEFHIYCQ